MAWIRGARPILVDSGYGSDLEATRALLPGPPALLLNTHWHSDHVGGNAGLAAAFGMPIAASAAEGARVNARDPAASGADWLDQRVDRYRVDRLLEPGEIVDSGDVRLTVVAAPGHSPGQIALFEPESRVLVAGDALLPSDVPWINPVLDGEGALEAAMATLERIARLEPRIAVAGHGAVVEDVPRRVAESLARMREWRDEPERMLVHGARRVFGYALMIHGGFERSELDGYLLARGWVRDFAARLGLEPLDFGRRIAADLVRSGAARWDHDRLRSSVAHAGMTMTT